MRIGRGAPVIDGLARRVVIGHPASLPPKPERRRSLQYMYEADVTAREEA